MADSILNTVKKLLPIPEAYDQFDSELIIHINSALVSLRRIGVGPDAGFRIVDKTATWTDFIPELLDSPKFEDVKTYIYLKVKMVFDPPTSSIVAEAIKENIKELTWNLNVDAESNDEEEIQNGE